VDCWDILLEGEKEKVSRVVDCWDILLEDGKVSEDRVSKKKDTLLKREKCEKVGRRSRKLSYLLKEIYNK